MWGDPRTTVHDGTHNSCKIRVAREKRLIRVALASFSNGDDSHRAPHKNFPPYKRTVHCDFRVDVRAEQKNSARE
jgi:hypothetical protein